MIAKTKIGTLDDILRSRSRAIFAYRVNFDSIGYENLEPMKEWCEQNCKSIWRAQHTHALYFQFENDYDATMFMLRWGGAPGNKLK